MPTPVAHYFGAHDKNRKHRASGNVKSARPISLEQFLSQQPQENAATGRRSIFSLANRYSEAVLAEDFLIIVRTLLAATVGMMDAAIGRSPQGNDHVQGPDRQATLMRFATAHF